MADTQHVREFEKYRSMCISLSISMMLRSWSICQLFSIFIRTKTISMSKLGKRNFVQVFTLFQAFDNLPFGIKFITGIGIRTDRRDPDLIFIYFSIAYHRVSSCWSPSRLIEQGSEKLSRVTRGSYSSYKIRIDIRSSDPYGFITAVDTRSSNFRARGLNIFHASFRPCIF